MKKLILLLFSLNAYATSYFDNATVENTFTLSGKNASTVPYLDSSKSLVSSAVTPTQLNFLTLIGSANGLAPLDGSGKISYTYLPSALMTFKGAWDASTNSPTLVDGTGLIGDTYRVSVAGTHDFGSGSISFFVGDFVIYNGAVWQRSPAADGVISVDGLQGAVTLSASSPLTHSAGSFGCQTASGSQAGCLAASDFTSFSNKLSSTGTGLVETHGITVNGQGGVISTGSKGFFTFPYAGTISKWWLAADQSGSVVIDIKRSGTSIIGGSGNKPTLSSAQSGNATPSSWTSTSVSAGDILEYNVDSASTITRVTLTLSFTRN